jgi:hypothetical protein
MTLRESMTFHSYWATLKESNKIYKEDVKSEVGNIYSFFCPYICVLY